MRIKLFLPIYLVIFGFAVSAHAETIDLRANKPHESNSVYLKQLATHNPFSNVYSARSSDRLDTSRWANKMPVKAEPAQLWPTNRKPVGFATISKSSVSKPAISKASISKTSKRDTKHIKSGALDNIEQNVADAIIADIFLHGDNVQVANAAAPNQPVQSMDNEAVNAEQQYVLSATPKTIMSQPASTKAESKRTASIRQAPARQWSL
jgi:hypothetical protein